MSVLQDVDARKSDLHTPSTGYAQPGVGHNGLTREQWLKRIIESGAVTRISQHLALVIFHLSDVTTNVAHVSMRDLERITGWGRQTIHDHLCELEIFIRMELGRGRRKTAFEMQGVITEAVRALRPACAMASQPDAKMDANPDANLASGSQATKPDAKPDDILVASQPDAKLSAADIQPSVASYQPDAKSNEGGTIGGELEQPFPSTATVVSLSGVARAEAPAWMIDTDGSFLGQAFEITEVEYDGLRKSFPELAYPGDLVAADQFLANEFGKDGTPPGPARFARLHQYLAKQNRSALAERRAAEARMRSKAEHEDDSCRWEDAQLVVANGFRAELLARVQHDENRLNVVLDKAVGKIPLNLRGPALRKLVKSEFAKHADWDRHDERRTSAIEQRGSGSKRKSSAMAHLREALEGGDA